MANSDTTNLNQGLHWHPSQVICPSPSRNSFCFILDAHTHTYTTTITGHIPNPSRGYSLCLTLPDCPRYPKIPSNGLPRARGMALQRWRVTSATDHRPCPPQDCRLRIDGRLRRPGAASSTPDRVGTMAWMHHPGI